jgi:hypothetical protein
MDSMDSMGSNGPHGIRRLGERAGRQAGRQARRRAGRVEPTGWAGRAAGWAKTNMLKINMSSHERQPNVGIA